MQRIFRTKGFSRWMAKTGLTDSALCKAVAEIEQGLVEANLGGYLFKKRIALSGRGKSGGARTIVATRFEERWFFLYGFKKNERSTIPDAELEVLQERADVYFSFDECQLATALKIKDLVEVHCG